MYLYDFTFVWNMLDIKDSIHIVWFTMYIICYMYHMLLKMAKTNQRKFTPRHHQYPEVQLRVDLQIPTLDP